MENLEDKSLKELLEIRDKRIILRIKEEEAAKKIRSLPGFEFDPLSRITYSYDPEIWHEDDNDIAHAVLLLTGVEKNLGAPNDYINEFREQLKQDEVDEPRIPFVVWVGAGIIILLILKRLF